MLRKIFIVSINSLILISLYSCLTMYEHNARSGRNDPYDRNKISERVFSDDELELLKETTTLFVLRNDDNRERFEKMLDSVWDITNIEIIRYDEIRDYDKFQYSFFLLEGISTHTQFDTFEDAGIISNSSFYINTHFYLTLKRFYSTVNGDGIPETKEINYCRIELFPDYPTIESFSGSLYPKISDLYKRGELKNWSPGMLKLYLMDLRAQLIESKREFLFEEINNPTLLKEIENDTLFIPDYILNIFNATTGAEDKKHNSKELFEACPFPYLVIDRDSISSKIMQNEIRYVLDYVKSSTDNFIRIYDLEQGKIYQRYKKVSYNIYPRDIRIIFREIR